jgi:hypothetical protein
MFHPLKLLHRRTALQEKEQKPHLGKLEAQGAV